MCRIKSRINEKHLNEGKKKRSPPIFALGSANRVHRIEDSLSTVFTHCKIIYFPVNGL